MEHHKEPLPKPSDLGFVLFAVGIILNVGIFFALSGTNIFIQILIPVIYFTIGIWYKGALWGTAIIFLSNTISERFIVKGISWNPLWFLPMIMRFGEPVLMGTRQITLEENYVCKDEYKMKFCGIISLRTVHPAGILRMDNGQHGVDHQIEETIESAARPYIAEETGLELWKGVIHKKNIEQEIENYIKKKSPGYEHDDMVIAELGQEVLHITVSKIEPPEDVQQKHKEKHFESIERDTEIANMYTVAEVIQIAVKKLRELKLNNLTDSQIINIVQSERNVIKRAVEDRNFDFAINMDNEVAKIIGEMKGITLDPKTQSALVAAIVTELKKK